MPSSITTRATRVAGKPVGVSVLLCTYNAVPRIAATLACLARQHTEPGTLWEIIFVDNASTDATAELARQTWESLGAPAPLHLLREERPGKQYALEMALSRVSYCYTCIVDDDNRLAPDYLGLGLAMLEAQPRVGILGGPNTATFEGPEPAWFAAFQYCYAVGPQLDRISGSYAPLPDGNIGHNVLWGAGMFVRTSLWQQLTQVGFKSLFSGRQGEANLTAGEDDELCYAAQLLGYEVWYSSRLRLHHHMAAGRLTETYRNRLFYASVHSATRLNAYRNALWGKQDAAIATNLLKDIGYGVVSMLRNICSVSFIRGSFAPPSIGYMHQRHAVKTVRSALGHFSSVKKYYQQVLQLKARIDALPRPEKEQ